MTLSLSVSEITNILQMLTGYIIGNWESLVIIVCAIAIVIAIAKSLLKIAVMALIVAILCIILSYLINGDISAIAELIPLLPWNLMIT